MYLEILAYSLHTLFGTLWAGSMLFVAAVVLPAARTGKIDPPALGVIFARFRWLTRISVLVTFVTGGHLAGTLYTTSTLSGSTAGQIVLVMLGLWLLMAAVIEIGTARAMRSVRAEKRRQPIHDVARFYAIGAVCAVGLFLTAGILGANRVAGVL